MSIVEHDRMIAELFAEALEGRFKQSFEHVVFAVFDRSADQACLRAFQGRFASGTGGSGTGSEGVGSGSMQSMVYLRHAARQCRLLLKARVRTACLACAPSSPTSCP